MQTLHGAFLFQVQRCPSPHGAAAPTYLELTEPLGAGSLRTHCAACSAYDSQRLRSDEVAGLRERVTGARLLSDQTRPPLVVTKAMPSSAQGQAEVQAPPDAPTLPAVAPHVDGYDVHSEAGLVLTAALQVKQHKARRGQGVGKLAEEPAHQRVNTDGWLVAKAPGGLT
jgi:hypothetical protein